MSSDLKSLRSEFKQLEAEEAALDERKAVIIKRKAAIQMEAGLLLLNHEPQSPAPEAPPELPSGGQGARLLALLRKRPHAPQTWYAEQLYLDPAATGKVSSLLDYLRKKGRARNVGYGKWEATK